MVVGENSIRCEKSGWVMSVNMRRMYQLNLSIQSIVRIKMALETERLGVTYDKSYAGEIRRIEKSINRQIVAANRRKHAKT